MYFQVKKTLKNNCYHNFKHYFRPRLFTGKQFPFRKWFLWKVNSGKVNYFLIFGSVIKSKLENTF
jgi:hypothetical protein